MFFEHAAVGNFDVMMISLDVAVCRDRGDLAIEANRKFWKDQVLSGRVIGAHAGPPCES